MSKLSEVIAVAEKCVDGCMANCPYNIGVYRDVCTKEVLRDALELLKSIPHECPECAYSELECNEEPCWSCEMPGTNWRWKYGND